MNMYSLRLPLAFVALVGFLQAQISLAQSGQYQRPKPSSKPGPVVPGNTAAGTGAPVADAPPASPDQKVDIQDLEKKYWVPKDTEFKVVQNRTYTKAGRFALTPSYGLLLGDSYSKSSAMSLAFNYYFSERTGLELSYIGMTPINTPLTDAFVSRYGTYPNHGKVRGSFGAGFNWIPIYAKLSLLEKQIIYFDMSFTPGIYMVQYDQQVATGTSTQSVPAIGIDVAQHFYLNKTFAIRMDLKNRLFNEDVKEFSTGAANSTKLTHTAIFMLGVSIFPF